MSRRSRARSDSALNRRLHLDAGEFADSSEYESEDYEFGVFIEHITRAQKWAEYEGDYPPKGHGYSKRWR
ncbi:hypothetical protein AB0H77_35625 [Streptomyces sp. NPDC050844]|uniref:hypothetical protein n=1 Tax=Streptomyces sp. NPDC050844 TaxID=3155790 RepID=UPI0033C845A3